MHIDQPGQESVIVLAHGAGAGMEGKHMLFLRDLLVDCGVTVARFNFPYRQQGKSIPDKMPVLMESYRAAVAEVGASKRLVCAGHSMGGRVASMLASDGFPMDGLLLFSYPLHPAGQPAKLRDEHLPKISAPTLCINGTQDELCQKELMEQVLPRLQPNWTMHWLAGADHSLKAPKSSGTNVRVEVTSAVREWLASIGGP